MISVESAMKNLTPERLHVLPHDEQKYLIDKYTHSKAYLLEVKSAAQEAT